MQGAPCSTTLQRTFLARQHWQALDARRFTLLAGRIPLGLRPASVAERFCVEALDACRWDTVESDGVEDSDIVASNPMDLIPVAMGQDILPCTRENVYTERR